MRILTIFTVLFLVSSACTKTVEEEAMETTFDHSELVATVMPVGDSGVEGSVTFTESSEGVLIQGNFNGLEPGMHGFHIHQYGDCRADDGTSAGGHFNPADMEHGAPSDDMRHMGDLGNLEAGEDGNAVMEYVDSVVVLDKILGRGIIIHAGEDDFESQPTGAAGSRVACGVIGIAQE